ncbi:MauE/DoxX family redox-associated membrane protein [Acrocarpospora catenulata]|uniref:MauE/DoxX family redox-associated membrane protein n=1 Tax=Acrocarpospora catenulata TaxID=2836182 RepID=UPI001BDA80D2|nr:MauE/DoxX family redox-associated membrane protein [Acrocarpospora catenulata]
MILVRYALGAILLLAVTGKLRAFRGFRDSLAVFGVRGWTAPVAIVIAEAGTAAVAFSPLPNLLAGIAGLLLGLGFTAAQTYLLVAGESASCQCFGVQEKASAWTWSRAAAVLVLGLALVTV